MAVIFKNPDLTDYFTEAPDVRVDTPPGDIEPIIPAYEAGKVIYFPKLKFDIDFNFWAKLRTDRYPGLKKLPSSPRLDDLDSDPALDRKLAEIGVPSDMEQALRREIRRFYEQALPIYEALFRGYDFTRRQVVWRLNTIRNENLHVDTYKEVFPDHFARVFINLDTHPRMWMTGYTAQELYEQFGSQIPANLLTSGATSEVWAELNRIAYGGKSDIWWDRQPRHVAYFDPGDVWAVDSRQVAHQIFYGRRAVSIDFFVNPASMLDPDRQYLRMAEGFRADALGKLKKA